MPMGVAQNILLYVLFLVFVLCFLALVIVSLYKLEKIFRLKYYRAVSKFVLESLNFFHLNAV